MVLLRLQLFELFIFRQKAAAAVPGSVFSCCHRWVGDSSSLRLGHIGHTEPADVFAKHDGSPAAEQNRVSADKGMGANKKQAP